MREQWENMLHAAFTLHKEHGAYKGFNFVECNNCKFHAHAHMRKGILISHGYGKPWNKIRTIEELNAPRS